ncbi:MAG TPA: ABC transporter substrate-binding protein [Candidatus Binatia bacterium]
MKKKIISLALGGLLLALNSPAEAQQPTKIPRIGYLSVGDKLGPRGEQFLQGLREVGYRDGKNIVIEYRGDPDRRESRLPDLAGDLVRLKVDVIVALDPPSAGAAKNATKTIPIVIRTTDDPVRDGLVASLARPGGNITGLYSISAELIGKRLEVLKETVSGLSRVAVLWNPGAKTYAHNFQETEAAARSLGLRLQSLEVRAPKDFENAFRAATKERSQALFPLRNPMIVNERKRIAELASKFRLPGIYDEREFVESGGLMSYGTNLADLYHRAATYVDKILKGAKPADLPVEQPTKFELVINLKTAKALGLTIPPSVLARADQLID